MYIGLINQYRKYMPLAESTEAITLNEGNISAYWKGFNEYYDLKIIDKKPRVFGFQAAGAAPIVDGTVVKNPETIATAIRIGNPASLDLATKGSQVVCVLTGNGLKDPDIAISSIEPMKVINSDYDHLKSFIGGILND